ncbi:MAG: hypothetical protein P1U68_01235 [Verrucomicrobiales bacterium]|nr:hypothetical protein [Verrucomicrobiales bacterium]
MRLGKLLLIAIFITGVGFLMVEYTRPGYPIERTLQNEDGREIKVLILGHEGGTITVDRVPGGERFEIPIETLSLKDRLFCLGLRESEAPPKIEKVEKVEPKEDNYVVTRRKAIEDLKIKKQVILEEISSKTLNDLLHQSRVEQLGRVQKEIAELELAIKTYKYRMKQ